MSELENKTQPTSFEPDRPQAAPQLPGPDDNGLADILAALKPVPERDPLAAARSRARFMTELEALGLPNTPTSLPGRLTGWLRNLPIGKKKEKTTMSTPAQRFAFSSLALIALIVVFLFGGAGTTVFAAQSALPGDALFRVKTSLEQTQTSLSNSAAERAELHLEFAERRLSEIERLVTEKRFQDIGSASSEFEAHISAAEHELLAVEKENPEKSVQLSQKISDDLLRFNQTLSEIKHQVPDDIKGEVEHAIQAVQAAPAGDELGGDERGKGTLEPGDDRGTATPEPGDDKGASTLEPGDDMSGSTLEPGDDKGSSTLEPGDAKGGASGSPTQTPGVEDKSGKNSSGAISATPTPGSSSSRSGSGSGGTSGGSGGGSGSGSGGTSGGSGSGSGGTSGGSGGGSGSGSGGSGGGSGGDGGGHK